MMIQSIIFDKDGVLLDLEATWFPVALRMTELLDEYSSGHYGAAFFQEIIGINASAGTIDYDGIFAAGSYASQREAILAKVPDLAIQMPIFQIQGGSDYQKRLQQYIEENHQRPAMPKGPVRETLLQLQSDGYKLAVLTNDSEESARRGCEQANILPLFDMIVGYDSGFGSKPDPAGYLAICAALNTPPETTIMVGDTSADSGAAHAAGARHFIGVSARYPERTLPLRDTAHIMPDIGMLPEIIAQLD